MAEKKVTGPASYFPSIEKNYGKPIEHWMKELKKVSKMVNKLASGLPMIQTEMNTRKP